MKMAKTMPSHDAAKKEFGEIKEIFNSLIKEQRTLEEMCGHFGGQLDPVCELFDFDYKHLTATIFKHKGELVLSSSVDVWDENGWDYRSEVL